MINFIPFIFTIPYAISTISIDFLWHFSNLALNLAFFENLNCRKGLDQKYKVVTLNRLKEIKQWGKCNMLIIENC